MPLGTELAGRSNCPTLERLQFAELGAYFAFYRKDHVISLHYGCSESFIRERLIDMINRPVLRVPQ